MNEHPSGQPLPGYWEEMAKIRESLGRIEATLGFIGEGQKLNTAKVTEQELRIYALEQVRGQASADHQALNAQLATVQQTIAAYDISPPQFKIWKAKVDEVVTAFQNSQLAISVRQSIRSKDLALLGTLAALTGMVISRLPDIFKIISGG